ncbi:DNA-binding protein, YbaB/EbfC family [Lishizhenia tianjinensis]|uniref:Nucleoid-associated protein SAMN05216474_2318 n=2 Tax=Lishizhenia tianjinensis TaxID=477690 RepID=A0A1I7AQP1_9FLAO|nr:DNA-binding protein, YbaB/EbfC family [Lishizhenia tianjinensis]
MQLTHFSFQEEIIQTYNKAYDSNFKASLKNSKAAGSNKIFCLFSDKNYYIMFGGDMFGKLQEMQQMAEESKKKLDQISVQGEAGGNLVVVELTGNRTMKSLTINTQLDQMDKEDLEDLLTVAFNRALEAAEAVNQKEMQNSAKGLFPGL